MRAEKLLKQREKERALISAGEVPPWRLSEIRAGDTPPCPQWTSCSFNISNIVSRILWSMLYGIFEYEITKENGNKESRSLLICTPRSKVR